MNINSTNRSFINLIIPFILSFQPLPFVIGTSIISFSYIQFASLKVNANENLKDSDLAFYIIYREKAKAYMKKGDWDQAIYWMTKALDKNPKSGYTYFGRAIAKMGKKDKRGACKDIKKECFLNDMRNLTFLKKKTSNKYNKKSYAYKSKRES